MSVGILKYFTLTRKPSLPKPDGPLSKVVPSVGILLASKEVKEVLEGDGLVAPSGSTNLGTSGIHTRGPYEHFTTDEKAKIGKKAAEIGVAATVKLFSKQFHGRVLKENSVRTWRDKYLKELERKRKAGEEMVVHELPEKKRGRPCLLSDELDKQVQSYLLQLRDNGSVVNTNVAIACALGLVKHHDSNLLKCNGGHLELSKSWAKYLMQRMGFVKRRASTAGKISAANFVQLKAQFLFDVRVIREMEEVPDDLIINWDQTGIHYVPVSNWTMQQEGSKRVEITGLDDKRQITAVFAGTAKGDFLPPQLIYQGKTPKCLPSVSFPPDWHITYSENHWSNEQTMLHYLENILFPYVDHKRQELNLDSDHPALVIFDRFRAQCTSAILTLLEDKKVRVAIVPGNCTDRLQPLDVSVNKAVKDHLRKQFQDWYSDQVCKQLQRQPHKDTTMLTKPIDLRMNVVKPLSGKWMMAVYQYIKSRPDIIKNGFHESGITV